MKYIIIGLGNFGASLGQLLTHNGHEVIGVDNREIKTEEYKDLFTATICLNSTEETALRSLPLSEMDATIVTIGEDLAASVQTIALLKKLRVSRIIGRALSPLHQTIIEAIGIAEILNPEQEAAKTLIGRLESTRVVHQFAVSSDTALMEIAVTGILVAQTIDQIGFEKNFSLKVLGVKREKEQKNMLGQSQKIMELIPDFESNIRLHAHDHLLLFGHFKNFKRLFKIIEQPH